MADNDSRPVPDPTTLTTDALLREIGHIKELVFQRLDLEERNRVEQKKDMKEALDAALTAAKDAVKEQTIASDKAIAKSETDTSKRLEELAQRFDDLKDRVLGADARKEGGDQRTAAIYAFAGFLVTLFVLGAAVLAFR